MKVSETLISQDRQISFLDLAAASKKVQVNNRRVEKIQLKLRQLHEELNATLYTCPASEHPVIQSPYEAYDLVNPFLENLDHEELWIILLNTRNRVISLVKLYQGSTNSAQVRISEVFRQAIVDNSKNILVVHNHPSGDPTPSPEDVALTKAIVQAGKLLDIEVLDHLVIGLNRYVSLKERGLGFS
jgi:DNA repair protein RadC